MTLYRKFANQHANDNRFEYLGHYVGRDVYLFPHESLGAAEGAILVYETDEDDDYVCFALDELLKLYLRPQGESPAHDDHINGRIIRPGNVLAATLALAKHSLESHWLRPRNEKKGDK